MKRCSLALLDLGWRALLPGLQVECALLTHWGSSTWDSASFSTSTSTSTSSCTRRKSSSSSSTSSGRTSSSSTDEETLPRFVRCHRKLRAENVILSHWLGNPLKAAALGFKVPVTISFTLHLSNWNPDDYVTSCAPRSHLPGNHATLTPTPAAGSSRAQPGSSTGPKDVTLSTQAMTRQDGCVVAVARTQDMPDAYANKTYDVVLQEQVAPAAFILHLKPHSPNAPRQDPRAISPAGQGPGLQVFPGTIPCFDCDARTSVLLDKYLVRLAVPKAMVVSQLPPTTTFPTDLTLIIKDLGLQGDQPDQHMTVRMYRQYRGERADKWPNYVILERPSRPLAAYGGRHIMRMALTADKQLTLYLAPAATAATNGNTGLEAEGDTAGEQLLQAQQGR